MRDDEDVTLALGLAVETGAMELVFDFEDKFVETVNHVGGGSVVVLVDLDIPQSQIGSHLIWDPDIN